MSSPFNIAKIQRAIFLHFTSDFDAAKYHFNVKMNYDQFERSNTKFIFEKLSRLHYQQDGWVDYFTAYALQDIHYIRKMTDETIPTLFIGEKESLQYHTKQAVKSLLNESHDINTVFFKLVPERLMSGSMSILVATALLWQAGGTSRIKTDHPMWANTKHKIDKLIPLLGQDWQIYRDLISTEIEKCLSDDR
jgi:hypothetical protein